MGERRCRYCQKSFQPSKFQPRQTVCGQAECQQKRRTDYHRGNAVVKVPLLAGSGSSTVIRFPNESLVSVFQLPAGSVVVV
jgi:hypothetical protein